LDNFSLVVIYLFVGVFLTIASLKRIRLLLKGLKALKEGIEEISIFYKDRNQVESENTVIPAWSDHFYFYAYLAAEKEIKTYRWEGIIRVLHGGKELEKDDLLKMIIH